MNRRQVAEGFSRARAAACAAALTTVLTAQAMAQTTEYYFNYDADATGATIPDEAGNGHDLGAFFAGSFQYATLSGSVPVVGSARAFDVANSIDTGDGLKKGGLTDANPFDELDFIPAGGYTFETWINRNANDGLGQHIWNPEGMHSIEILGNPASPADQQIQLAIRGVTAFSLPVESVIPAGGWHHLMAVMSTTDGVGGVEYKLLVDGVQAGPTLAGNLFSSFTTLQLRSERHGIGWNEFGGAANGFNGQLAYTRLSLGVVDYEDSLAFAGNIPEPSTLALLGLGAAAAVVVRRRMGC